MRRRDWLVLAVAVAIHLPSVQRFFVSDDFLNLERNTFETLAEGLALFSARDTDFWRPLPRLHFGVLAGFFSDRVVVWNLLGALLHGLASVAALRLLEDLLGPRRRRAALLGAILFAVHWIHAEPVLWASGVTSVYVGLFLFLALRLGRRARREGRTRDAVLSVLAFAGALLSKETAIIYVPLAVLVRLAWPGEDGRGRALPRGFAPREVVPVAILLAAWLAIVLSIDRGGAASPYRLAAGVHVVKNLAFFLLGGFAPVRFWEVQALWVQASSAGGLGAFLGALLARPALALPLGVAAAALAAAAVRGGRDVRGGLAWIVVAALPFVPLPGSGERFLYVPSFGACLVVGVGLDRLLTRPPAVLRGRARAVVAAAIAVAVLGHLDRQRDWRLASRWTRGIVDRWGYFEELDPSRAIEFVGIPGEHRSAWVFRNGFASMVRLYWQGRPYWREEERPADPPPALRMRVHPGPDGSIGMEPVGAGGRG